MTIQLSEINTGDRVGLMDPANNVCRGIVTRRGVMLLIMAFGTPIEFARVNSNGKVVAHNVVSVIEHTPSMFGGAA